MLIHAVTAWPPRLVHAIARLLGFTSALGMFCGHCPPGTWGEGDGQAGAAALRGEVR